MEDDFELPRAVKLIFSDKNSNLSNRLTPWLTHLCSIFTLNIFYILQLCQTCFDFHLLVIPSPADARSQERCMQTFTCKLFGCCQSIFYQDFCWLVTLFSCRTLGNDYLQRTTVVQCHEERCIGLFIPGDREISSGQGGRSGQVAGMLSGLVAGVVRMAPLALVPNLATRWRHLYQLQIWPPGGTTLPRIALLA